MVNFCIPLTSFSNSSMLMGRPSVVGDSLTYIIDKTKAGNIGSLMRIFGMASARHKHDIVTIIKVILKRF